MMTTANIGWTNVPIEIKTNWIDSLHINWEYVILIAIALIIIWLIIREFRTWYWKINERIGLQKETNKLLQDILSELQSNGKKEEVVSSIIETPFSTTSL